MEKLDKNFSLEKYGLKVRLVNENDASFILSLRTNAFRTKYMITLDGEIESQKKWIQKYTEREKEGLDYYFIYSNDEDKPIGLNRLSHIDYNEKSGKASSWIAVQGLKYEPLKMLLLGNEIVFNEIGAESTWGEVHKMNKSAIKIFKLFGYVLKDIRADFYHFSLIKDDFYKACENSLLNRIKANNRYIQ